MHLIVPVEVIVKSCSQVAPGEMIVIRPTGRSHLKVVDAVTVVFSEDWAAEHWVFATVRSAAPSS